MQLNIHSVIPVSGINGPGSRMVVFFQGCKRDCPGCFNPETHALELRNLYAPDEIFEKYYSHGIDGLTVSGGEPFLQAAGLHKLLELAQKKHGLSAVVYTGFSYEELIVNPDAGPSLKFIDVLVDGMYDESKKEPTFLARGSVNQQLYFLSGRYRKEDFYMQGKVEIIIGKDGFVTKTGFSRIPVKNSNSMITNRTRAEKISPELISQ